MSRVHCSWIAWLGLELQCSVEDHRPWTTWSDQGLASCEHQPSPALQGWELRRWCWPTPWLNLGSARHQTCRAPAACWAGSPWRRIGGIEVRQEKLNSVFGGNAPRFQLHSTNPEVLFLWEHSRKQMTIRSLSAYLTHHPAGCRKILSWIITISILAAKTHTNKCYTQVRIRVHTSHKGYCGAPKAMWLNVSWPSPVYGKHWASCSPCAGDINYSARGRYSTEGRLPCASWLATCQHPLQ